MSTEFKDFVLCCTLLFVIHLIPGLNSLLLILPALFFGISALIGYIEAGRL